MVRSTTVEASFITPSGAVLAVTLVISIAALVCGVAYISDSDSTMTLHNLNVKETLSGYRQPVVKLGFDTIPGNLSTGIQGNTKNAYYDITKSQSSTLFVYNFYEGISVRLPKAEAGLHYEFAVGTSLSFPNNDGYHLATTHGNSIMGSFMMGPGDTLNRDAQPGMCIAYVGTSVANTIHMDGHGRGGAVGTKFSVECLDGQFWVVKGHLNIDHDGIASDHVPENPFTSIVL